MHTMRAAIRSRMCVVRLASEKNVPEGYEVIYTKYITLRNGKRLYASDYGRTAWRLVVRKKNGNNILD